MELLYFIGSYFFMDVLYIIGFIAVFVMLSRQSEKIRLLQKQVKEMRTGWSQHKSKIVSDSASAAAPEVSMSGTDTNAVHTRYDEATQHTYVSRGAPLTSMQEEPNAFIEWVKVDWLLKLGALLIFIGFGWFVSYAFANNWIGPVGRITLGLVAGAALLVFGWWRMRAYIRQGAVFMVVGSTVVLLTTYAGRLVYDFFTPESALVIMFGSVAFVALASVQYARMPLALASLLLAGVAPQLTHASTSDYIGLFSYLLVVVLGALWITAITGWRILTTAALVLVALYSVPYFLGIGRSIDENILLLFMFAFVCVIYLANTAGILFAKGREILTDTRTAAFNGLFLIVAIMSLAPEVWQSLMLAAWAVIFVLGGFLIFKSIGAPEPLYVYAGVAIAMLGTATSAELSGATLTLAFIFEAVVVSIIAYVFLSSVLIGQRAALLLLIPGFLSFESMQAASWRYGLIHEDFFVLLCMGLALIGLGLLYMAAQSSVSPIERDDTKTGTSALFIVGSIFLYILLWLSLHAVLLDDDTAVMLSLVVYTVVGIIAYFKGFNGNQVGLKYYGGILLGVVVARLLLVDVWEMELTGRIITFFLIGALLMGTAFLGKLFKRSSP